MHPTANHAGCHPFRDLVALLRADEDVLAVALGGSCAHPQTEKVVRDDLLIALHLALDLVRDCCVLGMLLRDRAEGTNHHRHGGIGNIFVAQLRTTARPFDAAGILDSVEQSSILFDSLAAQWSDEYKEHRRPLVAAINRARRDASGA